MRLWLDDIRDAPRGWTRTETVRETVRLLQGGQVREISLDFDLGETDPGHEGDEVLDWLKGALRRAEIPAPVIHLHTMNPLGAAQMTWKLRQLEKEHGMQPMKVGAEAPRGVRRVGVPWLGWPWLAGPGPGGPRKSNDSTGLPDGDVVLAKQLLQEGALLLDVRTPEEYASGHLSGAYNVPHDIVQDVIPELEQLAGDRERAVVAYCVFGRRGKVAKDKLLAAGFPNVLNIGGLDGLLGRPLVKGEAPGAGAVVPVSVGGYLTRERRMNQPVQLPPAFGGFYPYFFPFWPTSNYLFGAGPAYYGHTGAFGRARIAADPSRAAFPLPNP